MSTSIYDLVDVKLECCEEKELILKYPAQGMLDTFPYQKKWEGIHPGAHKRHDREWWLAVIASASGELFIAKSW